MQVNDDGANYNSSTQDNSGSTTQDNSNQDAATQENDGNQSQENKETGDTTQNTEKQESGQRTNESTTQQDQDKDSQKTSQEDNEEPPVRKTKIDYILERKNKQIERLKQERAKANQDNHQNNNQDTEDEGEDLSPEEEAKIVKVLEKRYGKTLETVDALANSNEETGLKNDLQTFLSTEEGKYFKEFETKILAYAKHPNRANIPISAIAYEVAGPKLLKIGAKMAEDARKEALAFKGGGGNTQHTTNSKPDINKMTPAEFEAYKNGIKYRERD